MAYKWYHNATQVDKSGVVPDCCNSYTLRLKSTKYCTILTLSFEHYHLKLASFPGLPMEAEEREIFTEHKPKNKKRERPGNEANLKL